MNTLAGYLKFAKKTNSNSFCECALYLDQNQNQRIHWVDQFETYNEKFNLKNLKSQEFSYKSFEIIIKCIMNNLSLIILIPRNELVFLFCLFYSKVAIWRLHSLLII